MLLSTDSLLTAPDLCWTGPFLYQSAIRLEKTSVLILALGPPATTEIAVWIGRCTGAPGHGRGRMGAKRTVGAHPAGTEAPGGRMRAGRSGTVLSWGRAERGGLSCHSAAPSLSLCTQSSRVFHVPEYGCVAAESRAFCPFARESWDFSIKEIGKHHLSVSSGESAGSALKSSPSDSGMV